MKILIPMDHSQEPFLCGRIKTTITGNIKTWVKGLVDNIVLQFGGGVNPCSSELTHHRVSSLIGKAFLLHSGNLKAQSDEVIIAVLVQLLVVRISIDITYLLNHTTIITQLLYLVRKYKFQVNRLNCCHVKHRQITT